MTPTKFQITNFKKAFSAQKAFYIALVSGLLLTLIIAMAHVGREWVLEDNFHFIFSFASNFILIFLILCYSFTIIKSNRSVAKKYIIGTSGSLLIAALESLFSGWLHRIIYDDMRLSDPDSVNIIRDFVVAVVAILIALLLYNFTRRQQMRLEKEQLQNENLIVRYEALENQLDPHFLFNSLNTLSGLIGTDDEKAQQYLHHLAASYRYIMQGHRLVSLEDELDFVDSYTEMMELRYGKNLKTEKKINPRYLHYQIIPISLQLLIENAIKHNVVSNIHPLTLHLETTPEGAFRISNHITPKQENANGTGLGLANLRKRYELLCNREVVISKKDSTFSVDIPLLDPLEAAQIISNTYKPAKTEI